jgi:leucyl aminopeptidase (aminopeptidase T)
LPGAQTSDTPYKAMQDALGRAKAVRTIHFHWTGAFDFSTNPTAIDSNVSKLYQRAVLETNYDHLTRTMNAFEDALRRNTITVVTGNGNRLTFRVGDRPVTKQDGDASLGRAARGRNLIDREIEIPAGAIRVAPLEETVEGTISMPDAVWDDRKVEGLVLTFKKGKITDINALIGAEAVKTEIDRAGDVGHSFRELAVGFNPLLAIPDEKDLIPYYGYGQGVVRLSLGDNAELGGKIVGSYVRISLFSDASVLVGNEVWIRNGKMVRVVN